MKRVVFLMAVAVIFSGWSYAAVNQTLGGLQFNDTIYRAFGIEVYGGPEDVPDNDFKQTSGGYYSYLGHDGEFRFHGFDLEFRPYTNIRFPNDATSTVRLENKDWLTAGWIEAGYGTDRYQRYLRNTDNSMEREFMKEAYREMLPFPMWQDAAPDECLYIQTFPTLLAAGEGVMWHRRGGTVWYQTFSLAPLERKLPTSISLHMETPEVGFTYPDMSGRTVRIPLEVALMDGEIFRDPVRNGIRYQREDLDHFVFAVNGIEETVLANRSVASASCIMEFPIGEYALSQGRLELRISVYAVYVNGDQSETKVIESEVLLDADLLSWFNTANIVIAEDVGMDNIVFADKSRGQYEQASVQFIAGDHEYTCTFGNRIDNVAVRWALLNFIQSKNLGIGETIRIIQTIESGLCAQSIHEETVEIVRPDQGIQMDISLPGKVFDMERIAAVNNTEMGNVKARHVFVDGREINFNRFFSGQYRVGAIDQDRWVEVMVVMETESGCTYRQTDWILILTTRYQINLKQEQRAVEGREFSLLDLDDLCNSRDLLSQFPADLQISLDGTWNRTEDGMTVVFEEPGFHQIVVKADNGIRKSQAVIGILVHADLPPVIAMNLYDNEIYRGETLPMDLDIYSPDGDDIHSTSIHVEADLDLDGIFEQGEAFDPGRVYTQLGQYRLIVQVEESDRSASVIREFRCENHRPVTTLSIGNRTSPPKADLLLVISGDHGPDEVAAAEAEEDELNDHLLQRGYDARVRCFLDGNLTLERVAYLEQSSGEEEPAATLWVTEDGYSGSLMLESVENRGYYEDQGRYVRRTSCRDIPVYEYIRSCSICGVYVNALGYRMCKFCTVVTGTTRECTTRYVWVPKVVWVDEYVGWYGGTLTRTIAPSYEDDFREDARKVIVVRSVDSDSIGAWEDRAEEVVPETEGWFDRCFPLIQSFPRVALVGEPICFAGGDADLEEDPISVDGYRIHREAGDMEGIAGNFEEQDRWIPELPVALGLPGYFIVEKRVRDEVIPGAYSKTSNIPTVTVKVHRPPVAEFIIDHQHGMELIDFSYDPDYRSAQDRGIIETHLIVSSDMTGKTYAFPEDPPSGEYTVEWWVTDRDGAQAASAQTVIVGESAVGIEGKLTPTQVRIGETVQVHDILFKGEGRYHVEAEVIRGSEKLMTLGKANLSLSTEGTAWPDKAFTIPEDWMDGRYAVRLSAAPLNEKDVPAAERYLVFDVASPIDLSVTPLGEIERGQTVTVTATTAEYVHDVRLITESSSIPMEQNDGIWQCEVVFAEGASPLVRAQLGGKTEEAPVLFNIKALDSRARLRIVGDYQYWRGQSNLFGLFLPDMPQRLMAWERAWVRLETQRSDIPLWVIFDERLGLESVELRWDGEKYTAPFRIPLVPSTMNPAGVRLQPPYTVAVHEGESGITTSFDITGNLYDRIHLQPAD